MADSVAWPMPGYPTDLGEPEQVFRQTNSSVARVMVRIPVYLLLALAIGYGGYRLIAAIDELIPSATCCCGPVVLVLLLGLIAVLGLPVLQWYGLYQTQRGDAAVMCSEGVAYYHAGVWRQARWAEIAEVEVLKDTTGEDLMRGADNLSEVGTPLLGVGALMSMLGGDIRSYIITTKTSEQIEFGQTLSGITDLIATVRQRTLSIKLADVQNSFDAGEKLYFGPVTISKVDGIECDDQVYAWEEVGSITLEHEDPVLSTEDRGPKILKIKPRTDHQDGIIQVPKSDVPDVDLLMALAADRMGVAFDSTTSSVAVRERPSGY